MRRVRNSELSRYVRPERNWGTSDLALYTDAILESTNEYLYDFDVEDADGDAIYYYLIDGPDGAIVDPETGLVQWTATTPGDYDFEVAAETVDGLVTRAWTVHVTPPPDTAKPDLDIDSDNTNALAAPDRSRKEDRIEWYRGKRVLTNDDDTDGDTITDWLDEVIPGDHFTPLVLDLSQFADPGAVSVRFDYAHSVPGTESGSMRIWTVDADQTRGSSEFLASGTVYDASNLGFSTQTDTVTFYVEGVQPSVPSNQYIQVRVRADGAPPEEPDRVDSVNVVIGRAAPAAPTGLVITEALTTGITLDWNAHLDEPNVSYNVYRSTSPITYIEGMSPRMTGLTASNFQDGSAPPTGRFNPNTTYYYVVTAIATGSFESAFSDSASASPAARLPYQLTGVLVGPSRVKLDWQDEPVGTRFNVYRGELPNFVIGDENLLASGLRDTEFLDVDVPENAGTVYYKVTAITGGVEGAPSTVAVDTTAPSSTIPQVPGIPKAVGISLGGIAITWDSVAPDADGFMVYRSTNGGGFEPIARVASTNNVYIDSDPRLSWTDSYAYKVASYSLAGQSESSSASAPVKLERPIATISAIDDEPGGVLNPYKPITVSLARTSSDCSDDIEIVYAVSGLEEANEAVVGIDVDGGDIADELGGDRYAVTIPAGIASITLNFTPLSAGFWINGLGLSVTLLELKSYRSSQPAPRRWYFYPWNKVEDFQAWMTQTNVWIKQFDGTSTQLKEPTVQRLKQFLQSTNGNLVTEIAITGHGSADTVVLGNDDYIKVENNRVLTHSDEDLTDLLKNTLSPAAVVHLQSCHSALGSQSIAQQLSDAIDRVVTGNSGLAFKAGTNTVLFENDRAFDNGSEVDASPFKFHGP